MGTPNSDKMHQDIIQMTGETNYIPQDDSSSYIEHMKPDQRNESLSGPREYYMALSTADDKGPRLRQPTDYQLEREGQDVEILGSIHRNVIAPRLKHLSGFKSFVDWRRQDEPLDFLINAFDMMPYAFRSTPVVRLTPEDLKFTGEGGWRRVVVYLTRSGEYVTVIRQVVQDPEQRSPSKSAYAFVDFQVHRDIRKLSEWWADFSTRHKFREHQHSGHGLFMLIIHALVAFLDEVEQKRQEALDEIHKAQQRLIDIYPNAAKE